MGDNFIDKKLFWKKVILAGLSILLVQAIGILLCLSGLYVCQGVKLCPEPHFPPFLENPSKCGSIILFPNNFFLNFNYIYWILTRSDSPPSLIITLEYIFSYIFLGILVVLIKDFLVKHKK